MLKNIFISSLVFIFNRIIFSQNANFFPIAIGNEYQYVTEDYPYRYFYGKIERDTVYPNGKTYYHLPSPFDFQDCRVDSNGNILSISKPFFSGGEPEEYLLFKSDAQINDVWAVAWNFGPVIDTGYARCIFNDSLYVFGEKRRVKGTLIFDESYYYYFFWLAEGIGLIREQYDDGTVLNLNYAKINGIVYGALVLVDEEFFRFPLSLVFHKIILILLMVVPIFISAYQPIQDIKRLSLVFIIFSAQRFMKENTA